MRLGSIRNKCLRMCMWKICKKWPIVIIGGNASKNLNLKLLKTRKSLFLTACAKYVYINWNHPQWATCGNKHQRMHKSNEPRINFTFPSIRKYSNLRRQFLNKCCFLFKINICFDQVNSQKTKTYLYYIL